MDSEVATSTSSLIQRSTFGCRRHENVVGEEHKESQPRRAQKEQKSNVQPIA